MRPSSFLSVDYSLHIFLVCRFAVFWNEVNFKVDESHCLLWSPMYPSTTYYMITRHLQNVDASQLLSSLHRQSMGAMFSCTTTKALQGATPLVAERKVVAQKPMRLFSQRNSKRGTFPAPHRTWQVTDKNMFSFCERVVWIQRRSWKGLIDD